MPGEMAPNALQPELPWITGSALGWVSPLSYALPCRLGSEEKVSWGAEILLPLACTSPTASKATLPGTSAPAKTKGFRSQGQALTRR